MIIRPIPFFRGVRLAGHKSRTRDLPIEPFSPAEVAVPLARHLGAPAVPLVQTGDRVRKGQTIGAIAGKISANVHASVSGTVKAVEERPDGRGGTMPCVVIAADGSKEEAFLPPLADLSPRAIVERIEACGIIGMGGAGFPTHIKLSPSVPVDTLILNGAECEPYLTCDDALMRERTDAVVRGAKYMAQALGVGRILVAIEKNKPEAIAAFAATELAVVPLKKQYPMGAEKQLIYCCTKRKVPLGKLPADAGVIVQNVATAFAVCEAVEQGKPLIERIVTVTGEGVRTPKNLLCPVGTPLSALAEACGADDNTVKLVEGGPMTGAALTGTQAVVTKTTGGFLFLSAKETSVYDPTPCINCGRCADVCPMKLLPMQTEFYTDAREYDNAEKYGGVLACIECGACSYVCPAHRPLAQAIKTAKAELRRKP